MIPLKDNIPSRTFPIVNIVLIAVTSLVFLMQLADHRDGIPSLVERYGMIPARVLSPDEPILIDDVAQVRTAFGNRLVQVQRELEAPRFSPWATLVTSMFLHGGWLHFLGNMWFLFIFGDNVEDRFGHLGYLLFYLAAGVGAGLMHLVTNLASPVPTIGASGAIAGVMGAYLLLYPRARVLMVLPILFFLQLMVVPATIFLVLWFALQLFQGTMSLASGEAAGVAWWAHIGGFAFGFAVTWLLRRRGRLHEGPRPVAIHSHRVGRGDWRDIHDLH